MECFACYCKDEKLRQSSTSGGFFGVIAHEIIRRQGVVYGAMFDESFSVVHGRTETDEGWSHFQGSKYLQSSKRDCFRLVREDLKQGRWVFFTGTPCEVQGLRSFLAGETTDKLICMDFICLGIPSPVIWRDYINHIKKDQEISNIRFKDKRNGWKNFTFFIQFSNGNEYAEDGRSNIYFKSLFQKLSVRPSCFSCLCRTEKHISDFTVGDGWGLDKSYPEMFDDRGLSSLMVNTENGMALLKEVSSQLVLKKVELSDIKSGNGSMFKAQKIPWNRKEFFSLMKRKGTIYALEYESDNSFIQRARRWFHKLIGKVRQEL